MAILSRAAVKLDSKETKLMRLDAQKNRYDRDQNSYM